MTQCSINSKNPVLQIVSAIVTTNTLSSTVLTRDNSIPQIGEGDQFISLAITPKFSTSLLEITLTGGSTTASQTIPAGSDVTLALFQDATAAALTAKSYSLKDSSATAHHLMTYFMTSGTTSSTTFTCRIGDDSGLGGGINQVSSGTQLFDGTCTTILTITEYWQ